VSEAPSAVFAAALVDARAGESAAPKPAFRDPLATHQTTSVVPLGRNRHMCSASSSLTNNPTNPEPTRRRKTSTDRQETSSDRANGFAHNRQHNKPRTRERTTVHASTLTDDRHEPRFVAAHAPLMHEN
jgi:hypothetical protein